MIKVGSRLQLLSNCSLVLLTASVLSGALLSCPASWGQSSLQVHTVPDANLSRSTAAGTTGLHLSVKPVRVDVDLVLVPVTVTDTFNRPVLGLEKNDFKLLEDGREQEIRLFSSEDSPLSVALILDVSGSMANKISIERDAVAEFSRNAHPEDEYIGIAVADKPMLMAESSRGIDEIQTKLATVEPAGYTALMDAIYLAMNQLRSARYQRRVILLISDGGENDSRYKTREIKELAEESGILIYAIRPFDALPMFRSLEEKLGNRTLSAISEATGGRTISLSFHDNVPAAAAAISLELRNQYLLGYHSTAPPRGDKWRKIKIRIAKPADGSQLQVHHRKAYFVEGR